MLRPVLKSGELPVSIKGDSRMPERRKFIGPDDRTIGAISDWSKPMPRKEALQSRVAVAVQILMIESTTRFIHDVRVENARIGDRKSVIPADILI